MNTDIIQQDSKENKQPAKRKAISKRIRFEVFKRDKFSCQYCGLSAPDVVLHVDHINPVSKGGDNDTMNLITSCKSCNLGKSNVLLSDDATIQKQRAMLEELSEKREQLEMMLTWRDELRDLDDRVFEEFKISWDFYIPCCSINEKGEKIIKSLIKSVGIIHCLDALEIAHEKYFDKDNQAESAEKVFRKLQGIAKALSLPNGDRQLFYIRGICRNRFRYVNESECISLLREAYAAGVSIETLSDIAKNERNWTNWRAEMQALIEAEEE